MGIGEDRISALPDSILHYILSFLPTKEAVGTSILSKRWRWLWTYISNLDFQYPRILRGPYPEEPQRFMRYVYNVLLLHCGTSIRRFNLTCDSCDGVSVNSWVSTVVRQQLQELSLSAYIEGGTHLLPLGVYTCESLTVLKIAICSGFKLPTCFSLPHLKRLDLSYAIFPSEHITDQLLSSSSVLEDLTLYKCTFLNHQMLLISSPTLKQLKLSKLCIDDDGRTFDLPIKVWSPNLERFVCLTRLLLRGYNLGDMPSLGYAKIMTEEVDPVLTEEERCDSVSMLFKGLHYVKGLRISADILQNLPHEDLDSELPIFHNLHHIRIARICEGIEILSLLRVTPNLQSLTFDEALLDYEEDFIPDTEDMPRCLQSSLRKVKIERYNGHKGEFNFIEFLLKNVLALGSMVITCGPKMPTYTIEVMEEWMRILMLPKGSQSSVIGFFDSPLLSDSE